VTDGALVSERAGRHIAYRVQDTTFTKLTQT
jgi:hypothetical protein